MCTIRISISLSLRAYTVAHQYTEKLGFTSSFFGLRRNVWKENKQRRKRPTGETMSEEGERKK